MAPAPARALADHPPSAAELSYAGGIPAQRADPIFLARALLRTTTLVAALNLAVPLLLSLGWCGRPQRWCAHAFAGALAGVVGAFHRRRRLVVSGALHHRLSVPVIEGLESVSFTVGRQKLDLWLILHGLVTALGTSCW